MAVLTVCVSASILLFYDVLGIVMPVNFLVISMQNMQLFMYAYEGEPTKYLCD